MWSVYATFAWVCICCVLHRFSTAAQLMINYLLYILQHHVVVLFFICTTVDFLYLVSTCVCDFGSRPAAVVANEGTLRNCIVFGPCQSRYYTSWRRWWRESYLSERGDDHVFSVPAGPKAEEKRQRINAQTESFLCLDPLLMRRMFTQKTCVSINKNGLLQTHTTSPRAFFLLFQLARKQSTTVSAKRIHRDFISIRRAA